MRPEPKLFSEVCTPTASLVLKPRDRILPFLQGPLLRASTIAEGYGVVLALAAINGARGRPRDIGVRYCRPRKKPRFIFRVSERVALRIKEPQAIGVLYS